MPTESLVVVALIFCVFVIAVAAIAYAQCTAPRSGD